MDLLSAQGPILRFLSVLGASLFFSFFRSRALKMISSVRPEASKMKMKCLFEVAILTVLMLY